MSHVGVMAESLAQRSRIAREEQDRFALRSQEKANAAIRSDGSTTSTCRSHQN
ncbi:hypothetical protein [Mesorhizobium sp. B1-1-8]|uniref:thiolase family protein n=1 Tax=Mesorhizobium sp. B1-1-8 TaxID=2589976 RepID=UPI001D031A67|nr:hypothetical protein [Mesorhizobium sp. B1-1-8]UCI10582.1 hypothetical protein FJ974_27790 [Mesorhizobium sp. B1-1-8]